MYVKSLTLRGFKSFASTTKMQFTPGIVCIVGPNGSGKSNVVDALAWVMGEQGAKTLRGGAMSDVIFAGTSARSSLGRAEVQLTIDNSSGQLPIDYSEVTIARTLFRNGSSEYAINGSTCRLLDIQELLSDTGMGKNMHVIVGQGQLDQVLSADPASRRGLVEEAAGVLKHQRRKDRTLKKLEQLDEKLLRLADLTEEIKRQLGPLARQAKSARKASILQAQVRDSGARILADDLAEMQATLERCTQSEAEVSSQRQKINDQILELRQHHDQLQASLADDQASAKLASCHQELTVLEQRFSALEQLAAQRVKNLVRPLAKPEGPAESQRLGQLDRCQSQLQVLRAELGENQNRLREGQEKLRRQSEKVAQLSAQLQVLRQAYTQRQRQEQQLKSRREQARVRKESLESAFSQAEQALQQGKERERQALMQLESAREALVDPDTSKLVQDHQTLVHKEAQARLTLEQGRDQLRQLQAHRQAQLEVAASAKRSVQSMKKAAQARLAKLPNYLGQLSELCQVSSQWARAIAAIFSNLSEAAVFQDNSEIFSRLDEIKSLSGRATWLTLDRPASQRRLFELPDEAYWASEVVQGDAKLVGLLEWLLADWVLVKDLSVGQKLLSQYPQLKFACQQGDLLTAYSGMIGQSQEDSAITVQSRLNEAEATLGQLEGKIKTQTQQVRQLETQVAEASQAAKTALEELRQADAQQAKVAKEIAGKEAAFQAAQAETQRSETALGQLEANLEEASKNLSVAEEEWQKFSAAAEEQTDFSTLEAELESARREENAAREGETKARLEEAATKQTLEQAQQRYRGAQSALEKYRQQLHTWHQQTSRRERAVTQLRQYIQVIQESQQLVSQVLRYSSRWRQLAQDAWQSSSGQLQDLRQKLDRSQTILAELTDQIHRDQVASAEYRVRFQQLVTQAQETYGLEPAELIAQYGPQQLVPVLDRFAESAISPQDPSLWAPVPAPSPSPEQKSALEQVPPEGEAGEAETQLTYRPYDRAEQQQIYQQASEKLKRLGKINPLALEEHAALEQRYKFLIGQLSDLKQSKADLMQVIKSVTTQIDTAFASAYRDIAQAFEEVFQILFPGGQGKLTLTDPTNMLTTGIEVEARPAGKKVKRLSLLSGGERSLAALAFLVAIFKARPSPFYILDEVEAALDDLNLSRLLTLFKELRQVSQLIVITHQKRTMEIADLLYGVTMREGVSRVISQRLVKKELPTEI